jgi:hypothetical protein
LGNPGKFFKSNTHPHFGSPQPGDEEADIMPGFGIPREIYIAFPTVVHIGDSRFPTLLEGDTLEGIAKIADERKAAKLRDGRCP